MTTMQLSFICLLLVATLGSCNSQDSKPVTVPADTHVSTGSRNLEVIYPSDTIDIPQIFTDALTAIFERYEKIGIELSSGDEEEAAHLSDYLVKMINNLPLPLRKQQVAVDTIKVRMADVAKMISKKEGLDQQREQFAVLTSDLLALLKQFKINTTDLYINHCPGTNSKTWDWITTQSKSKNPYNNSGCGSAIGIIKELDNEDI